MFLVDDCELRCVEISVLIKCRQGQRKRRAARIEFWRSPETNINESLHTPWSVCRYNTSFHTFPTRAEISPRAVYSKGVPSTYHTFPLSIARYVVPGARRPSMGDNSHIPIGPILADYLPWHPKELLLLGKVATSSCKKEHIPLKVSVYLRRSRMSSVVMQYRTLLTCLDYPFRIHRWFFGCIESRIPYVDHSMLRWRVFSKFSLQVRLRWLSLPASWSWLSPASLQ